MLVLATSNENLPTTRDPIKLRARVNGMLDASPSMANDEQYRKIVTDCCQILASGRPSMKHCVDVLKTLRQKFVSIAN